MSKCFLGVIIWAYYFVMILQKRGANICAEFLGGSFTCDAYHMTEPHPDGNMPGMCLVLHFSCHVTCFVLHHYSNKSIHVYGLSFIPSV